MIDNEDIIRMAIDAGATGCANPDKWGILEISYENLERFAALVAAHEREECAKLCEEVDGRLTRNRAPDCAVAVRRRGEK
jgi:hypothetical protein